MQRSIYLDSIGGETRRLVEEDGQAVEFAVSYADEVRLVGNIYLGVVRTMLKGMNAAFVDIGLEKNAFLSCDDMPSAMRGADSFHMGKAAAPRLRCGQEVIVQVVKEPGGSKGPKVNMNPAIAGRYIVLLPTLASIGISRHIQDAQTRVSLQALAQEICPEGMGLVLRTASAQADAQALGDEVEVLAAQWRQLAGAAQMTKAPACLRDDGNLLQQTQRDLGGQIIEGPFSPEQEAAIEKLLRRRVWLDSGGYLIIDRTEALTVIDVNSGKNTGKRSLRETILALNMEAAGEIARQLRFRDISGIIVIDFVDMQTDEERAQVEQALRQAFERDRAKRRLHGFSGAGLYELTRRAVYQPVTDALCAPCPCCRGEGTAQSDHQEAYGAMRRVRRRRQAGDESTIVLRVRPQAAAILRRETIPDTEIQTQDGGGQE